MFGSYNFRYFHYIFRRNPGFACLAVLILAIGIGANTAIFSLVDTVILRPLPYKDPSRLAMIWQSVKARGLSQIPFSQADFIDFRKQSRSFESLAAVYIDKEEYALTGSGDPEQVRGIAVTANLFSLLGIQPALGRDFLPDEDKAGNQRKVILSHGLWQRRFAGERSIVGKTIQLDRQPYTVVGVMPRGFSFPPPMKFGVGTMPSGKELWVPTVLNAANRDYHPLAVIGRLKPDVQIDQARAELDTLAHSLELSYPKSNSGVGTSVSVMLEQVVSNVRPALLVLLGTVACVLLVACVNVANLLLARAASRGKELAVRTALGARRRDLIQQMLAENFALAVPGGALGVLLAVWATDLLRTLPNTDLPRLAELSVNPAALAYASLLAVLTGLAAGLVPALTASRVDLNDALKQGSRTISGGGQHRLRNLLVISQIAVALVLLTGAGLLIRSFRQLIEMDPGFRSKNLLTMELRLPHSRYTQPRQLIEFEDQLRTRIRAMNGVESVGAVNSLPIVGFQGASLLQLEGRQAGSLNNGIMAGQRVVSPQYFATMGIPLQAGRDFDEHDIQTAMPVVIVNQTLASRYYPGESPIGKRIRVNEPGEPWQTIVGVVGDVRHSGLTVAPDPEIFTPYMQDPWGVMAFVIRTHGDSDSLAAAVRTQLWSVDKEQPVSRMSTMDRVLSDSLAGRRLTLILLGSFAGAALLLALMGIYGVIGYAVVQRTSEIAIRMALGAQRATVWKLVLLHAAGLSGIGVLVGLAASLGLTRWMSAMLFQVRPNDPVTIIVVAILVMSTALLASSLPTLRATRINPVEALRD